MKPKQNNLLLVTVMIVIVQSKDDSLNIDTKEDLLKIITQYNATDDTNEGNAATIHVINENLKVKPKIKKLNKCLDSIAHDFNPTDRIICVKRTKDGPLQTINKSDGKHIKENDLDSHVHEGGDEAYHVTLPLPEFPQVPATTSKSLEDLPAIFEAYLKKTLSSAIKTNISSNGLSDKTQSSKAVNLVTSDIISEITTDNVKAIKIKTNSVNASDESSDLIKTYIDVVKGIKPEYNWTVKPLTKFGKSLNESNNSLLKYFEYFLSKIKNKTVHREKLDKAEGTSGGIAKYEDSTNTNVDLLEKQLSVVNSNSREFLENRTAEVDKKTELGSKSRDMYNDYPHTHGRKNDSNRLNTDYNINISDSDTKVKLEEYFDYNVSPHSEDEDFIVNINESLSDTETNNTKSNFSNKRVNDKSLSDEVPITFTVDNNSKSNSKYVDINSAQFNNISNKLSDDRNAKWEHGEKYDVDNSEEEQSSKDDIINNDKAMTKNHDAHPIVHKFSNKKTLFKKVALVDDNDSGEADFKEPFKNKIPSFEIARTFPPFEIAINQGKPTKQKRVLKTKVIYEDLAKSSKRKLNKLKRTTRSNDVVAIENVSYEPNRINVSKNENKTLPKEIVKGHKITWTIIPSENKGGRYRRLKFEVRPQVERNQNESTDEEIMEELIEHETNIKFLNEKEVNFKNQSSENVTDLDSIIESDGNETMFEEDRVTRVPEKNEFNSKEADENAEDTLKRKTTPVIDSKTHSYYSISARNINHESFYPSSQAISKIKATTDAGRNKSASELLDDYEYYNENDDETESKPEIKRIPASVKYLNRLYTTGSSNVLPKPPHILLKPKVTKTKAVGKKIRGNNLNKRFGLKYGLGLAKSKKENNKNAKINKNKLTTLKPPHKARKTSKPKKTTSKKPKVIKKFKNKAFKTNINNSLDLITNSNVKKVRVLKNKTSDDTTQITNNKTILSNITKVLSTKDSKLLKNLKVASTYNYDNSTITAHNNAIYFPSLGDGNNNVSTMETSTEGTAINNQKLNSTATSRKNKNNLSGNISSSTTGPLKIELASYENWREKSKKFETGDVIRTSNKNKIWTTEETEYIASRPKPDGPKVIDRLKTVTKSYEEIQTMPEIKIDDFAVDSIETINVDNNKEEPTSTVEIGTSKTLNIIKTIQYGKNEIKNSTVSKIFIRPMKPITERTVTVKIQFQSTVSNKASQNNYSTNTERSMFIEDKDITNRTAKTLFKKLRTVYTTAPTNKYVNYIETTIPLNVKALKNIHNKNTIITERYGTLKTVKEHDIDSKLEEMNRKILTITVIPTNMSILAINDITKMLRPLSTESLNKTKCANANATIFSSIITNITTTPSPVSLLEKKPCKETKIIKIEDLFFRNILSEISMTTLFPGITIRTSPIVEANNTTPYEKVKISHLSWFLFKTLTTKPPNKTSTIGQHKLVNQNKMQGPKDSLTTHKFGTNSNKRKNLVDTEGGAQDTEEADYETFENEPLFTPEADENVVTTLLPTTKEFNILNYVKPKSIVNSVLDSLLNRTYNNKNEKSDVKEKHLNKIVKIFKSIMKSGLDVLNNKSFTSDNRYSTTSWYDFLNDREIIPNFNSNGITDLRNLKQKGPISATPVVMSNEIDKVIPINTTNVSNTYLRLDPDVNNISAHNISTFHASTYYDDTDYYDSESLRNDFDINSKTDANTTSLVEEILNFVLNKTNHVTKNLSKPSFNDTPKGYKDIVKSLLNVLLDKTMNRKDSVEQDESIYLQPKFLNLTINNLSPALKSQYQTIDSIKPDLVDAHMEITASPNMLTKSENIFSAASSWPSKVFKQESNPNYAYADSSKNERMTTTTETIETNKITANYEIQLFMTTLSTNTSHETSSVQFEDFSNYVTSKTPLLKNNRTQYSNKEDYSTQQSVDHEFGNDVLNSTPIIDSTTSLTVTEKTERVENQTIQYNGMKTTTVPLRISFNNQFQSRPTDSDKEVFVNARDTNPVAGIRNMTDTTKFKFFGNTDTNFTDKKRLQYDIEINITEKTKTNPNLIDDAMYLTTAKPKGELIKKLADKTLNSCLQNFFEKESLKVLPLKNESNAAHNYYTIEKNITTNEAISMTKSKQNGQNILQSIEDYTEVVSGHSQVPIDKILNVNTLHNKDRNDIEIHGNDFNTTSNFFSEQSLKVEKDNIKSKQNNATTVTKSNSSYTNLNETVSNPNNTTNLQLIKFAKETENSKVTTIFSSNTVNILQGPDVKNQVINNALTETGIIGTHKFGTSETPIDTAVTTENYIDTIESHHSMDASQKSDKLRDIIYDTNPLSIDITTRDFIPIRRTDVIPLPYEDISYVSLTNKSISEEIPVRKVNISPIAVIIRKPKIETNDDFLNFNKHLSNLSEEIISTTETNDIQVPKDLLVKEVNTFFNTTMVPMDMREIRFSELINGNLSNANAKSVIKHISKPESVLDIFEKHMEDPNVKKELVDLISNVIKNKPNLLALNSVVPSVIALNNDKILKESKESNVFKKPEKFLRDLLIVATTYAPILKENIIRTTPTRLVIESSNEDVQKLAKYYTDKLRYFFHQNYRDTFESVDKTRVTKPPHLQNVKSDLNIENYFQNIITVLKGINNSVTDTKKDINETTDEATSPNENQIGLSPNASNVMYDNEDVFTIKTAEKSKLPTEHAVDNVDSIADGGIKNNKHFIKKSVPNRETYFNRSVSTVKEYLDKTAGRRPNRETYVNRTTSSVDKYLNNTLSQNVNEVLSANMTSILQLYKKLWETYNSLLGNVTTLKEILPVVSLNKTIPEVVNLYRNKTDKNITNSDIDITYTNETVFNNDTYEDIEVVMEHKFRNKTYTKDSIDKIEKVEDKLINTKDLIKAVYTDRTSTVTELAENTATVMDFENKVYDDIQESEEGMYEVQEPESTNLQEMSKIKTNLTETNLENFGESKYIIPFNFSLTLNNVEVNDMNKFKSSVTTERNFIFKSGKLSEGLVNEFKPTEETVAETTIEATYSSVTYRRIPVRKKPSSTNKGTKLNRTSFFADVYSKMAFPSIKSSVNTVPISNKYWDRLLENEIERRKQFPIIQTYATEPILESKEIMPHNTNAYTRPLQNYATDKVITYPGIKVNMQPHMKPIILIETIKGLTTNTPEIKEENLKTDTIVEVTDQEERTPIDSFSFEQVRPTNRHFDRPDKTSVPLEQIIKVTSNPNAQTQELTEKITIKKLKNSEARKFTFKPSDDNEQANEVNYDYEVVNQANKFINNFKGFKLEQINEKVERNMPIDICGIDNAPLSNVKEGNGKIETYPWLGVLVYPRGKQRLVTTVVLITTQLVIASASDINKLPKNDFRKCAKVILGANCTGPRIDVVNYNYHKDFNEYSNTLALIQIDAVMLKHRLRPICAPPKRFNTDARFYTFVMADDCRNSTIQLYEMDYVPLEVCKRYYRRNGLEVMWPRHSACGKAKRGGQCIWPSGSILAVRQDQRWHLLGFGLTNRGCEAPSRYIDYGMYDNWVTTATTRMGQPAITRVAPNRVIFRRSLHEIQRFGLCDNEEMQTELFTDTSEVKHSIETSQNSGIVSYNLTILQNVDYQCIVFHAYNLNAMDVRKEPNLEIRRYCPKAPQYCFGGGLVRIDFHVVIHFYDAITYKVQAYGKSSRIVDPKSLTKFINEQYAYPPIPSPTN